jgi:hypothetical protein
MLKRFRDARRIVALRGNYAGQLGLATIGLGVRLRRLHPAS